VGGGEFIIHPIYVDDLARSILDCIDKPGAYRQVFCIGGAEAVTNAEYFRTLGRILGVEATIETIPLVGYLEAHPQYSGHLCHRCYDMTKLRSAGIRVPDTSLEAGLREQVAWLEAQT
jgi:nucleoside-diphosphate-sugar epimerase